MKTGLTLVELAQELTAQQETKRDFHAPTPSLTMLDNGNFHLETNNGSEEMPATDYAHAQMASRIQVPKPYYDRMRRESPDLLSTNVNHWLGQKQGETSLIRTLRSQVRAFLSNRYRIVDNHEILAMVMPELAEMGDGIRIASCNVTEEKMYLKVINTNIEAAISVGDPVQAGFVLSNGELGNGSISVEPFIYRLVCTNGLTLKDAKQRKNHAGRANESTDLYASDTVQAIDNVRVEDIEKFALAQRLPLDIAEIKSLCDNRPDLIKLVGVASLKENRHYTTFKAQIQDEVSDSAADGIASSQAEPTLLFSSLREATPTRDYANETLRERERIQVEPLLDNVHQSEAELDRQEGVKVPTHGGGVRVPISREDEIDTTPIR